MPTEISGPGATRNTRAAKSCSRPAPVTAPNAARAIREHDALCDALKTAGVELVTLPGFSVIEVEGSEIAINGGGGPTCLTRPLVRD